MKKTLQTSQHGRWKMEFLVATLHSLRQSMQSPEIYDFPISSQILLLLSSLQVDTFYGTAAWEEQDGFTSAQAFMNLVETALNFLYLYLGSTLPLSRIGQVNLVGFSAAILTVAKTVLYWLTEYYSGMRHTGHNDWQTYIFLWVVSITFRLFLPWSMQVRYSFCFFYYTLDT